MFPLLRGQTFTILQKKRAKLCEYGKKIAQLMGFRTILQKKRAKLCECGKKTAHLKSYTPAAVLT